MLDILRSVIDVIFPPPPCVVTLRRIDPTDYKKYYSLYRDKRWVALSSYHDPVIQAAITANKFHDYTGGARLLADLLQVWLRTQGETPIVLVPIPLSAKRQKERGYNQVERVLKLIDLPNVSVLPLLRRGRHTAPQTSLKRQARLENMTGAFAVIEPLPTVTAARVVLIDDVITTGATMAAARATLAPHLPRSTQLITLGLAH